MKMGVSWAWASAGCVRNQQRGQGSVQGGGYLVPGPRQHWGRFTGPKSAKEESRKTNKRHPRVKLREQDMEKLDSLDKN